jgi:hypothetical protein
MVNCRMTSLAMNSGYRFESMQSSGMRHVATRQIHDAPQIETQTLPEVLAWLCTQNSVPLTVLRQKLLPLGLLPSALINDVNERAFEIAGEPALDEATDNVIVQRGLLLQVLAVW